MSGTREGGLKAVKTNMEKYGKDFYSNIGFKGGSTHRPETRWFYNHRELARTWGRIGGMKSKRGKKKEEEDE